MPADTRTRMPRRSLVAAGGVAAVLTLAACSGSPAAGTKGGATSPAGSSSSRTTAPGAGRGPAAAGTIAAITGRTMQVQNQQTGQVAVTWTGRTTFTHMVTVKASTIAVGSCVTAIGASGTSATASAFTAASVLVSRPQNGSCLGGFARTGGDRPGGPFPSGARPSGFPSGARPSGFPGGIGARRIGAIAAGKVTAVSGATLTVAAARPGSSATAAKEVTVAATTKITTQAATTAKSLAVGQCVSAEGKADSSGTVTATRVQITSPTNGRCTVGFGVRRAGSGG